MTNKLLIYINIDLKDIFVGTLYFDYIKGKEVYSFQFSEEYLTLRTNYILDPTLSLDTSRQFLADSSYLFGFLQDVIPDRWGKTLIERKYNKSNYTNVDYLSLISDISRSGAIRINNGKEFLNSNDSPIPSYIYLNKLEQAASNIENDSDNDIQMLLDPGSSLGGARPKCSIYNNNNELFLAKFPGKKDNYDVEKFEYLANYIAKKMGIDVPEHKLVKLSNRGSTLLLKRFDRDKNNVRYPFVSMMTLLAAKDGDSGSYSYLDLLKMVNTYSDNPKEDSKELLRRLILNVILHNSDDHLRNHGMLYKNKQWRLSPAFDINPSFNVDKFTLSIDGVCYDFNLDKVIETSIYYGVDEIECKKMIQDCKTIINNLKPFDEITLKDIEKIMFLK